MNIDEYRSLHDRLASIRQKMKSAAIAWRASIPVVAVQHAIEFSRYGERSVLEVFVEVSVPSGRSVCWWIDLEPQNTGFIFYATLRKNNSLQETKEWERCEESLSVESALQLVDALINEIEQSASGFGSNLFESPEL